MENVKATFLKHHHREQKYDVGKTVLKVIIECVCTCKILSVDHLTFMPLYIMYYYSVGIVQFYFDAPSSIQNGNIYLQICECASRRNPAHLIVPIQFFKIPHICHIYTQQKRALFTVVNSVSRSSSILLNTLPYVKRA